MKKHFKMVPIPKRGKRKKEDDSSSDMDEDDNGNDDDEANGSDPQKDVAMGTDQKNLTNSGGNIKQEDVKITLSNQNKITKKRN